MELVLHDPRAHPPRMVAAGARARAGLGSRVLSCSRCIACLHAGRATLSRHVMSPHVQTFVLKVLRNGSSRYILYPCRSLWWRSCSKCNGWACLTTAAHKFCRCRLSAGRHIKTVPEHKHVATAESERISTQPGNGANVSQQTNKLVASTRATAKWKETKLRRYRATA